MAESSPTKNPLAFIIEDNEAVAQLFKAAVERADFEIELIPDGRIALERLAVVAPELILLDLHLPFASGMDILRYLRAEQRFAKTRIILTTADLLKGETLAQEVDYVLTKPFGFVKLHELAKELRASL
jgi:DNA-binding response OmpR family regulator